MKIQLNNGLIRDLPNMAVVAVGGGDVEVDNVPLQPFDYDYVDGEFVRMRWSDWHELTNFQIKFGIEDLLDMIKAVPAMADYTNTLITYEEPNYRYFYVNFFNEGERELITYFGGIINERSNI